MPILWIVVAAVLAAFVIAALVSAWLRGRNLPASDFPLSDQALISQAALKAVARVRARYALELDHTIDSIQSIETALAKLHENYLSDPAVLDLNSMSFVLGAYIGETLRAQQPGSAWERRNEEGAIAYALHLDSKTCFPMEWCMKRMLEGEKENVWTKYQSFVAVESKVAKKVEKSRSAAAGSSRT
jgi:hypothetical protein